MIYSEAINPCLSITCFVKSDKLLDDNDVRDSRFDCGDDDLNEFFFKDSILLGTQLLTVTYVMEENDRTLAFYSVSNDALLREDISSSALKRMLPHTKRFKSNPAVKIGLLAVNCADEGQGIGSTLLDYIKVSFVANNKTGCRFIVVDAYNQPKPLRVYQKNGFLFLSEKDKDEPTRAMYFDLMLISKHLREAALKKHLLIA